MLTAREPWRWVPRSAGKYGVWCCEAIRSTKECQKRRAPRWKVVEGAPRSASSFLLASGSEEGKEIQEWRSKKGS